MTETQRRQIAWDAALRGSVPDPAYADVTDLQLATVLGIARRKVKVPPPPKRKRTAIEHLWTAIDFMTAKEQSLICPALDLSWPLVDGLVSWAEATAVLGSRRVPAADREALAKLLCERIEAAPAPRGSTLQ
jgi:hypothetical protein